MSILRVEVKHLPVWHDKAERGLAVTSACNAPEAWLMFPVLNPPVRRRALPIQLERFRSPGNPLSGSGVYGSLDYWSLAEEKRRRSGDRECNREQAAVPRSIGRILRSPSGFRQEADLARRVHSDED